jgi:hypothetical protein
MPPLFAWPAAAAVGSLATSAAAIVVVTIKILESLISVSFPLSPFDRRHRSGKKDNSAELRLIGLRSAFRKTRTSRDRSVGELSGGRGSLLFQGLEIHRLHDRAKFQSHSPLPFLVKLGKPPQLAS